MNEVIEVTQEEFEENFDEYMDKIEKEKQYFMIRMPDGRAVAAIPALDMVDEEYYNMMTGHDDAP
jgi:hypothetical protein